MLSVKPSPTINKQNLVSQCNFFSGLSNSSKDLLASALIDKTFSAGQLIFSEGDKADGMYFIADGRVDIATLLETGKKINLDRLGPNQFFGEIALLDHKARSADATAATNVRAFKLSLSDFAKIAARFNGDEWSYVVKTLCALLRKINTNLESMLLLNPTVRIVRKLLTLPRESDAVRISQTELAEMVNLSRESTNKLLAELERDGLIKTSYGKIHLLAEQRLQEFSAEDSDAA